jgi:hypothetical protein
VLTAWFRRHRPDAAAERIRDYLRVRRQTKLERMTTQLVETNSPFERQADYFGTNGDRSSFGGGVGPY